MESKLEQTEIYQLIDTALAQRKFSYCLLYTSRCV